MYNEVDLDLQVKRKLLKFIVQLFVKKFFFSGLYCKFISSKRCC